MYLDNLTTYKIYIKVAQVIDSSTTQEHILCCEKLVQNFKLLYNNNHYTNHLKDRLKNKKHEII